MKLIDPLSVAWKSAGALFSPFRADRWFLLGFTAWLASFLSGTISNWVSSLPDPGSLEDMEELTKYGVGPWLAVLAAIVVVITLFALLFAWLGCRGQFMFLDNVLHHRQEIAAPWRNFARPANSLFLLYAIVIPLTALAFYLTASATIIALWPIIESGGPFASRDYLPFIIAASVFFLLWMMVSVGLFYVREFGVLWLYRNGGTVWQAAAAVGRLAMNNPVDFFLYLIIRLVMDIVFTFVAIVLCCLCGIGCIPYINVVLVLPIYVFVLTYAIECFAQLGLECDVRPLALEPPALTLPPPPLPDGQF